jgi:hypothetical protein
LTSCALKKIFFFGSPCILRDLSGTMFSLRFSMTSSQPLCLHVDRGLERHGYPWVPTDQGPGGPCQVDSTCQKPHRPASGPRDLIHNPGNLGRPRANLSESWKTCRACGTSFSPRSRHDAASRSADRGIHPVITEDDLPNLLPTSMRVDRPRMEALARWPYKAA